jgi:uncharacterized membrane protein
MKNVVKLFGIIALVAIIGFTVIACNKGGGSSGGGGGSNPKSLAQQAVKVIEQVQSGKLSGAEAEKQSTALEEKYQKLSEDDKKIYRDERDRLLQEMTK